MLDSLEQSGLASGSAVHIQVRDVSHVEDFNVAFTGASSLVGGRQAALQAARVERLGHALGQLGHRAGTVSGRQLGNAIGAGRDSTGPHVTGRQQNLEVQNIVRVGGATETDLDGLAVFHIGVRQVQNGHVAVLCREVRHDQVVANTTVGQFERGGIGSTQRLSIGHQRTVKNHSRSSTRKTQATNHGSNAQGQNIFLHIKNSS